MQSQLVYKEQVWVTCYMSVLSVHAIAIVNYFHVSMNFHGFGIRIPHQNSSYYNNYASKFVKLKQYEHFKSKLYSSLQSENLYVIYNLWPVRLIRELKLELKVTTCIHKWERHIHCNLVRRKIYFRTVYFLMQNDLRSVLNVKTKWVFQRRDLMFYTSMVLLNSNVKLSYLDCF